MDIDVKILINLYKEEIAKLQNENMILKAQLLQMQKNMEEMKHEEMMNDR